MNRSTRKLLISILLPVAAIAIPLASEAQAQVIIEQPSPAYIASYAPVYYNGYAHYWYRGRWFYRDHGAWRWYDREPAYLYGRRGEWGGHFHHWR
ncbi:MAG: hypothetical protein ACLQVI_34160 [Polyangiaceae bacterium]